MDNIKLITLSNGMELIGKLIMKNDDYYVFEKARRIHVNMQPDGSHGLALIPFSPINQDGDHKFYRSLICAESIHIPVEFVNAYIQQTTSIQIATSL
ncbi:MAG: hypothetical protein ACXW2E_00935 [Nitrososphaeraceae archaeon]